MARPARRVPLWLRRRPHWTTVLAASILVASLAAGLALAGGNSPAVAATVGRVRITVAQLEAEVAAIEGVPAYSRALSGATTAALAAPLSVQFTAAPNGDPDDLRVSAGAPIGTRPFSHADLEAGVLTRLLYIAALRQQLAAHHIAPDPAELADGRQQAMSAAGIDASGRPIYGQLPPWYRQELAVRAADVEALARALVGPGAVSESAVEAAYAQRAGRDFTTVCLRSLIVPDAEASQAAATLSARPAAGRDDGCAPVSGWAGDVSRAVEGLPQGGIATVERLGQSAVILVSSRTVAPLAAVEGAVRDGLLARFTDLVNQTVEAQLALDRVTVAARYGAYQQSGPVHDVVPPDALAPMVPTTLGAPAGTGGGSVVSPGGPSGHGQLDPFD